MTLKFFYNGIKDSTNKLQTASYSKGSYRTLEEGTITVYANRYNRFSKEVREMFTVENESDSMTDYFENDSIRVAPSHPLYAAVNKALEAQEAKAARRHEKYKERYAARHQFATA